MVLSWAAKPRDPDLHIFSEATDGTRAHVYWPRKGRWIMGMHLDVDVVEGYGPVHCCTLPHTAHQPMR